MSDLIDREKALDKIWEARRSQQMLDNTQVADLVMHGLYIAESIIEESPSVLPTHPTPSNTLGALDCVERRLVSYKLTDLVNEFEEILSHIREREENDSVCGLCEYDGAYMGQSGDWCNECPGFDKADCFKLKDKYKKEWLELMNTLPSVLPRKGKWLKAGTRMGIPLFECSLCECAEEMPTVMGKPSYNFCPNCGCRMGEGESE